MSKQPDRYSSAFKCGHCGNVAPMRVVANYSTVCQHADTETQCPYEAGDIYELMVCPACEAVTLRMYYWQDAMESEGDVTFKFLYPQSTRIPLGLPTQIEKAFLAALKVKPIDSNAFGVLLGRVLELICDDRQASGESLAHKLADLASKGEIPSKLVDVTHSLRKLRNVGAHAVLGELTNDEVPILEDLCRAILEYVYSAPHLTQVAENRVNALAARRKKRNR